MGVDLVTFGCRLNVVESEAMKQAALEAGHDNLVIVNSCAVTAEAVRQARQTIRRLKRERPDTRIVVTGCAAQIEPEKFASLTEVSTIIGNAEKTKSATWAALAKNSAGEARIQVSDIMAVTQTARQVSLPRRCLTPCGDRISLQPKPPDPKALRCWPQQSCARRWAWRLRAG